MSAQNIRNVCIIAHVDHGKTTLVDSLLKQSGIFENHQLMTDRVLDSMDLERERGITIMAKNASIRYQDLKINLVDTPGHADFGGEVERILGMVDGALLLVDAAEGPLPQTRFVLKKALERNLQMILVINKVDRPDARVEEVLSQTFDLFIDLGASDEQVDFPIFYACAREGWCTPDIDQVPALLAKEKTGNLKSLFDCISSRVPAPFVEKDHAFRMLVSNCAYSDYVGRLAIGRVLSGSLKKGDKLIRRGVNAAGDSVNQNFSVVQLLTFDGLKQVETLDLMAGDIGILAGCEETQIGDTLVGDSSLAPLPRIQVELPTVGTIFSVNTSPLSGKEGEAIQSRKLRERLLREVRANVALRFEETDQMDQFRVLGRGELQFAILIEQMRREGSEFMVGKPSVLNRLDEKTGEWLEPFERAVLDVPEASVGDITQLFQTRKGILSNYEVGSNHGKERVRLAFDIPTRGLLGIRSRFLTLTRGEGLMSTFVLDYRSHSGLLVHRPRGGLVADRQGQTIEYALLTLEDRGVLFVKPGVPVYEGMIIGENNSENDLNVNPCKEKKLTNMRAAHAEVLVTLSGIRDLSLEECMDWIDEDEWVEVTPLSIRIRKKVLGQNFRSVKRFENKRKS